MKGRLDKRPGLLFHVPVTKATLRGKGLGVRLGITIMG